VPFLAVVARHGFGNSRPMVRLPRWSAGEQGCKLVDEVFFELTFGRPF
jgi:hypothetical protein